NDGFFSNVISSSDEDQQNERDISIKKKLLTSSPTLLDRINKLRLNTNAISDTSALEQPIDIHQQRLRIIEQMQRSNDRIAEMNEKKQKFVDKTTVKRRK
ncbi:unnamed protein product, partial [Adineta ricciae]